MRAVFVGLTNLTHTTAKKLLEHGSEAVIIELDKQKIDEAAEELDSGFLHGDGSKPAMLREAGPDSTDILFCLTDNDQTNILSGLVARSLGFPKIVVKVEDPELELICEELGLENIIVPTRTAARFLTDMAYGRDILEISAMVKNEARFMSFVAGQDEAGPVSALELPKKSRVVMFYRDGEFNPADDDSELKKGDEVVIVTHSENLAELRKRFFPEKNEEE